MTKKLGALLIACASIVSVIASGCQESQAPARRKLTVVATGFLKGNLLPFSKEYSRKRTRVLGGYAHLAGRVGELAKASGDDGMLLVDLGNHMSGSLEAYASKGQMVVELMNKLPYAASLLSNMEFTFGQEVLRARAKQARFPYVSSNVRFDDASLAERVAPEVIKTVAGLKVAILGQSPDTLLTICAPEVVKGVAVARDLATLAVRAAELKKTGAADLVVLLSKISVDNPPAEVKKVLADSQFDLVLGVDYKNDGEAMTTWGRTMVTGLPGDNRGSRMKIVELSFDASKKIIASEAQVEVISPEVNPADAEVDRILADFKGRVMVAFAEKVGSVAAPLTKGWREEATLGNLIADGMRAAAGADLAVINSGAIQDDLAAGEVTVKDLFRVVPFDNNIVSLTCTGAQLKEALAAGLAQGTTFQVSGMSYRAKEDATGAVRLESLAVDGRDIDPARTYKLAITDFALSRLEAIKGSGGEVRGTVRNVLTNALKDHSPVERKPEGRVQFERFQAVKTAAGN